MFFPGLHIFLLRMFLCWKHFTTDVYLILELYVLYTYVSENGTGCSLCTSTYYLVNGQMPVSDDNMTASSFYNDPNIYLGPSAARFWDTKAGIWAPMVLDTIQYIQVMAMFEIIFTRALNHCTLSDMHMYCILFITSTMHKLCNLSFLVDLLFFNTIFAT